MSEFGEFPLTDAQRSSFEQQILRQAELVRDGATVNQLGKLVLTAEQSVQLGQLEMDIALAKFDLTAEAGLQSLLDQDIGRGWRSMYDKKDDKYLRALSKNHIQTPRDLLTVGELRIGRINNIGPRALSMTERYLSTIVPTLPWLDQPNTGYIASFCDSLEQIPAATVFPEGIRFAQRISVADLLEEQAYVPGELLAPDYDHDYVSLQIRRATRAAEQFELEFRHARLWLTT